MEQNCKPSPKYREQIAAAVSWELIYQLMRRYHSAYDLRVWETHPGGGQYDCLSLNTASRAHYFDFNLQAQSLHIWNCEKYVKRLDIIDEYLHCKNQKRLLDKLSSLAKLKKIENLPPSDGSTIACGFVATMFKMNIYCLNKLKMYMGYLDTSGYGGGIRRDKFARFPAAMKLVDDMEAKGNFFSLYRFFFLENASAERILCLIDMAGTLFLLDGQKIVFEEMYNSCYRNINIITNNITANLF